jgi:hypothetical protein
LRRRLGARVLLVRFSEQPLPKREGRGNGRYRTWGDFRAAVALYEAEGWSRVAADRQAVGEEVFDVWVYVAPGPTVA